MPSNIWSGMAILADWDRLVVAAVVCLTAAALGRRSIWFQSVTPKSKSLTFRVDDIPTDHADDLEGNLRPVLREAAATIVCRSVAPKDNHSVCATVSTTTQLSGEDLCARLRKSGKKYRYSYSCKFEGITPLCDGRSADVDVVAVPGLGSHALGSWKSPNSDDVWLRDFLPSDVPNIRVLLYCYDTTLPGSFSKQSIEDLGQTLLERIVAFRARDGTARRPIIFIGHSLGGLLIKEALTRACTRRSEVNSTFSKACFGLLFFGVPNLGLRNDQLRTLVRGQPNEALIHDLLVDNDSEPSTFLKRLGDQFSESCKGHYRVVSFFERTLSPTLELHRDKVWRKTGRPSLLVTEKSATNTGLVTMAEEDRIALDADHSGLVKYDSRNQGDYTIVRERTRSLANEAVTEVTKRFAEHNLYLPQSESTQACLRSLAFEDIDSRQNKIDVAAAGTCGWLLGHETLIQWTRQHRGLLWIKGKPGSGKSTMLKYAVDGVPSLYGTDTIALSFFFHGRGRELQRTPLGLFRSLLHQLLSRVPGALRDLLDDFEHRCKTVGEPEKKWQWHIQPLQTFLELSLPRVLKRFPVIIFIDALDECGEDSAVELIQYLEHFLRSLPPTDSRFGICFSCRHYPILELNDGLTILLDKENNADITSYVQARLSDEPDSLIADLIARRAQGVFLWAQFVVKRVLQLKRKGMPTGKINAAIKEMPQDLEDIYHGLIQDVNAEDRPQTLQLMQWICFSTRPLTTNELPWAMAFDHDCSYQSLAISQTADDFITEDTMDRRIKALSCGLAEIAPSGNFRVVQFIHQSVKDYFVERGFRLLDSTCGAQSSVIPTAHIRLAWSCVRYIKLVISSGTFKSYMRNRSRYPFLHYTATSWVSHMQMGESVEESPSDLLQLLEWKSDTFIEKWTQAYELIEPYGWRCPSRGSKLVHVLSRNGLPRLLLCLIIVTDDTDSKDTEYGRTALSWAAENGHESIVKMLLDTKKVEVDLRDNDNRSPLLWAAQDGHESIVKLLLDTGKVDVDLRDKQNRSLLLWAAENGHGSIVKMLLDTGKIGVDLRDKYNRSLLLWAA